MDSPRSYLPLKPPDFQLLLLLIDGPRHAYGLSREAEESGQARLEIGSLYRIIARMMTAGLIEEGVPDHPEPGDERRRYYGITPLGRRVAEAEARRLDEVLKVARGKRLLPTGGAE